ncbi:MAG: polyprenyl diphosphate synthase [Alphaproteobacteria bacterium]|nr:polyprenyl diphosphate synthase [Alphaproteobacteria bacterium]
MAVETRAFPAALALPRHVAIIMDGNGRWASARGLPRAAGHRRGAEAARALVRTAIELGIEILTLYTFSSENWRRSAQEVDDLLGLLRYYLGRELEDMHRNGVRLRMIGERDRLPADLRERIAHAEALTAGNDVILVQVAVSYGGRDEIVRAARRLVEEGAAGGLRPGDIDEAAFAARLDTAGIPDPDLLVRTGGEMRISNFLLWQAAYAELFFTERLWPEFAQADLEAALVAFSQRERRYGARAA